MKVHQKGTSNPIVEISSDELIAMLRKHMDENDMFKDRSINLVQASNGKLFFGGLIELRIMMSNIPGSR